MDGKLVLYIEDNPSNRKVMQHIFRMTPHRLIEALNGRDGLDLVSKERPDLILLDLQLPDLSGYDVARRLKADADLKDIPIIAVSAYALSGDDRKALEAGCDGYIAKPFHPSTITTQLQRYLGDPDPSQ